MKSGALLLAFAIGLAPARGARGAGALTAPLLALNETPGSHVGDRSGLAMVWVDGARVSILVATPVVERITSIRIRNEAVVTPGGITLDFLTDTVTGLAARETVTTTAVAADLVANPQDYDVVVRTERFPNGAYRGHFDPVLTNVLPPGAIPGARDGKRPMPVAGPGQPRRPGPAEFPAHSLRAPGGAGPSPLPPEDDPRPIVAPQRPAGTAEQTIRFTPVRPAVYLDPDFDLFATATSGLPVHFTASGDCSVSGETAHILAAGKCFLTAHQPGDSRYAAAPDVDQSSPIEKAGQKIRFPPPPPRVYLDPEFRPYATASSGLPIVFFAWGDCSVDRATVHILGAGSCSLTAHQPGDSNFTAARIVDHDFTIARADQTISFGEFPDPFSFPGLLPLTARASSGLPVTFAAWGSCVVINALLQIASPGTCTVTAQQSGNANFNPAPPVTQTFEVPAP